MKIAIIIDSICAGGAERQAMYMARELALRGCDVELIHYHRSDQDYDQSLAAPARVVFVDKCGMKLRLLWRLRCLLKHRRFDVVHAMKDNGCIYGCLAAAMARVPTIIAGYRTIYCPTGLAAFALKVAGRVSTAWVVNSSAVAEMVRRVFRAPPERVHLVHNGIDPAKFQAGLSRGDAKRRIGLGADVPTVAMIGRMRPEKNHEMFLRMARRVVDRLPNARFLLVGGEGAAGRAIQLRTMAAELGLAEHVVFLGPRTDIAELLAATDVSVLTSDFEGLSNVLLEAMSAGVPVVTTDYPGADEVIVDGENGYIVPRGSDENMADRVESLLKDRASQSRIGLAAKDAIQSRFSLDCMATNLLAVYRRYAAPSPNPSTLQS